MSEYQGTLDEIYNAAWVKGDFTDLQPEFDIVADAIYRQFLQPLRRHRHPMRVVDVGCGPANILNRLDLLECTVFGIEGSRHCIDFARPEVRPMIRHADITKTLPFAEKYDLVICTEVAEHLEEEHAPGLVALLCSAMCPIVFTAAPPGQDGHHHVNCQTQQWWEKLFLKHGVLTDGDATVRLRDRWGALQRLSHMANNLLVLT